uniref:Transcriptional regulator n=1 Tax=Globodera pallida TaxID=36090 RepID=A0A183C5A2_GLOPA
MNIWVADVAQLASDLQSRPVWRVEDEGTSQLIAPGCSIGVRDAQVYPSTRLQHRTASCAFSRTLAALFFDDLF